MTRFVTKSPTDKVVVLSLVEQANGCVSLVAAAPDGFQQVLGNFVEGHLRLVPLGPGAAGRLGLDMDVTVNGSVLQVV